MSLLRSINIKLIVPRKPDNLHQARDLWTTHEAINQAVAYYETILLEMRGEPYLPAEGDPISEEEIKKRLAARIQKTRRLNKQGALDDAELGALRTALRRLYEAIVPSSIGGDDGDAQAANAYLSPLMDPDSKGFSHIFEKIESPPPWLEGVRQGDPEAYSEAVAWLKTDDGKKRLGATGAPPAWVRRYRRGDEDWPDAFVADYDKNLGKAEGVPAIFRSLRDKKVLPLFDPFLTPRIQGARGVLSPWDRLAFRLAVGHLLSWENWSRKTADEYASRVKKLEDFRAAYLDQEDVREQVAALRKYEEEREKYLSQTALAPTSPFRINPRMIRSWRDIRERWLNAKDTSPDKLAEIAKDLQAKMQGAYGDPDLFLWLARKENHDIWLHPADVVRLVASCNHMERIVERSRMQAFMTLPDPIQHPRSVQWEPLGGTNLRKYRLEVVNRSLKVTLPLLTREAGGTYREVDSTFLLAPTDQLRKPVLSEAKKGLTIAFQNQNDEMLTGILKSADLLLDWDHLRTRPREAVNGGNIGPAYLKLVVDVQPILPEGWDGKRNPAITHFGTAMGNTKYAASVKPGLRVLSVDLGVRMFAACSVFELRDENPGSGKFCIPVEGDLWAVHERSFILTLPDEVPDARGKAWRVDATEGLRKYQKALGRYRRLYRLPLLAAPEDRSRVLDEMITICSEAGGWEFEAQRLESLRPYLESDEGAWKAVCKALTKEYRKDLGLHLGQWRHEARKRSRGKALGKSMWAIEHLDRVRRLLSSWSHLGGASGKIRRFNRESRGQFAGRLWRHINNIKDDRIKTGADLIVQAARGYLRGKDGKWKEAYRPCHAVLFEDLTRYRMKTDRPRRENSQLMVWSHRNITDAVNMQGALYGVNVIETNAAFSSRYSASTHTPGIRCHPLTNTDLSNVFLRQAAERENPGIVWADMKAGRLVPLAGGEIFVCLSDNGLQRIHADINAAQNLQRRLWTRHRDTIRIPCRRVTVNGDGRWVPRSFGKRLMGAMGGYGWLVPTGHDSGSCRWQKLSKKEGVLLGAEAASEEDPGTELDMLADAVMEESGDVVVFFRDPSGIVLPDQLWYPAKTFWSIVKSRTAAAIK
ncbi:MAG: type V CRISPR-associated protein Cas12b [Syntrophales bacterium]